MMPPKKIGLLLEELGVAGNVKMCMSGVQIVKEESGLSCLMIGFSF
jgi:hypothetical protein